jgi:hypothetical protein
MAVIYDANAPNDPEWYKLLNLLVMTASEALASAAAQDELRRMERALAISSASAKIADFCSRRTEKLKDGSLGDAKLAALAELEGFLSNLKAFGSPLPAVEPVKTQLPSLLQDFASELKAKAPAGLSVETQISGLSSAELPCSAKILKDGLLLAAAGRMASAAKAGAKACSSRWSSRRKARLSGSTSRTTVRRSTPSSPLCFSTPSRSSRRALST